jgi:hypothetical protein
MYIYLYLRADLLAIPLRALPKLSTINLVPDKLHCTRLGCYTVYEGQSNEVDKSHSGIPVECASKSIFRLSLGAK